MAAITRRILGCALVSLALGGCGALRAANARSAYVRSQMENLVVHKPLDEVWPYAQQLLFARGYQLKQTASQGAYSLETETRWESSAVDSAGRRYLVQGFAVDPQSCRVNFTAFDEKRSKTGTTAQGSHRDSELELQLLEHVEPQRAAEIRAEAYRRGEAARRQE